jgi:hypothetical protein
MTKARDLANGGFGLVLVKPSSVVGGTDNGKGTVTFSAASAVSLNNVFSSTYTNYKVLMSSTSSSGSNTLRFRMRDAAADLTTSTYRHLTWYTNSASSGYAGLESSSAANYASISYNGVQGNSVEFDIFNPKVADYTHLRSTSTFADGTNMFLLASGTVVNNQISYDGFTIYPVTAAITGTISVYGYNK